MKVFSTKQEVALYLKKVRKSGGSIGLVPTMGALHEGHGSLLKRAVDENTCTIVSIFVNPTQFNDPSDLEKYPRTPEKDLDLLEAHGADVVFMPEVKEMYPPQAEASAYEREIDLGGLDRTMEGADRPGHFKGVAQIVSLLFRTIEPHRAYFGEKDFQQLAIVKHMSRQLHPDLEIVSCPIIREKDGLAMSSRNARLNSVERAKAPFIYQTLKSAALRKPQFTPDEIRNWVMEAFAAKPEFMLSYYEIVHEESLEAVTHWKGTGKAVACIAVILGGIRLIDNLKFA